MLKTNEVKRSKSQWHGKNVELEEQQIIKLKKIISDNEKRNNLEKMQDQEP